MHVPTRGTRASHALLLISALSAAALATADVSPIGDDFQVNPPGASSSSAQLQSTRHVDAAGDGSFVVVWEGFNGSADPYNIYSGVWARRFDASGTPLTDRILVNSYTTGPQLFPGVASRDDGSFVVVWQSSRDGTINGNEVEARAFGADGTPTTDAFQVNTNADSFQGEPSVDVFGDGSFVVVWTSQTNTQATDIAGQRFDAAAAPLGTEFAVNSYTTLAQGRPEVATTSDGFVVVWTALDIDDSALGVVARRFDMTGAGIGNDFVVNTYTTFDQEDPDVATAPDGSFVVVWMSDPQDGDDEGVFGQRFDANGNPAGTEFQISVMTTDSQHKPSVHYDADGFIVAWTDEPLTPSPENPIETALRCYGGDGEPVGGEISVATAFDCGGCGTSVTRGGTGEYIVAWTGPPDGQFGFAVRARRFGAAAAPTCGDPIDPGAFVAGAITASDALLVLQAAVGAAACLDCVCDVDASGAITATDALSVLAYAVGRPVVLNCPAC